MKVRNEITVYEVDGKESTGVPMPALVVQSHWNRDSLVVIYLDGKQITVAARELCAAIKNATNTGKSL